MTAKDPYVMRRPIETHAQMEDEGTAWGDYYAGKGPKPVWDSAAHPGTGAQPGCVIDEEDER